MGRTRIRLKPGWLKEAKRVYAETGSVTETAKKCGEKWGERIPRGTMDGWLRGNVPLSEDVERFHEEWTAEDCIAELRKFASTATNSISRGTPALTRCAK